jgi:O-methyltransferase involved in polyketide biosynthesis
MATSEFVVNFANISTNPKARIESTCLITNRLFYSAAHENADYVKDAETANALFEQLEISKDDKIGLTAMCIFLPKVPGEILNRYCAIKHELKEIEEHGLDNLVIGACGLSPLGLIFAENQKLNVYDTDLRNIIEYRRSIGLNKNANYHINVLDLLDEQRVNEFARSLPGGKTALVIEGLTFYLEDSLRKKLHSNIKLIADYQPGLSVVCDYFLAELPARKRDARRNEIHPDWPFFANIIKNVHDDQKCFFKTRDEVVNYLTEEGFNDVKASSTSYEGNAHTVFTFRI